MCHLAKRVFFSFRGSPEMDYQNYAERIKPLYDFESFKPPRLDEKEAVRIGTKNSEMTTYRIRKTNFSQLNNKRFYFPNAVLSLPIGHGALKELDEYKKKKGQRLENFFMKRRNKLFHMEKNALKKCERLNFLDNFFTQPYKVVNVSDPSTYLYNEQNQMAIDFILKQGWTQRDSAVTATTDNSMGT